MPGHGMTQPWNTRYSTDSSWCPWCWYYQWPVSCQRIIEFRNVINFLFLAFPYSNNFTCPPPDCLLLSLQSMCSVRRVTPDWPGMRERGRRERDRAGRCGANTDTQIRWEAGLTKPLCIPHFQKYSPHKTEIIIVQKTLKYFWRW